MASDYGSVVVASTLLRFGVTTLYGMAGTQNVPLLEAVRASGLRFVAATSELAAGMMAVGAAAATGKPAVLTTIPGPGAVFALPALAEAALDSIPLLYITLRSGSAGSHRPGQHQHLDLPTLFTPVTQNVFSIERADEVVSILHAAWHATTSDEPGPVAVIIAPELLKSSVPRDAELIEPPTAAPVDAQALVNIVSAVRRPLLFCGRGAADAADDIRRLIDRTPMPVVTTLSGRGVIPEDHPSACPFDFTAGSVAPLNELVAESDIVLALGAKFASNGTGAYQLAVPREKLIHIDRSEAIAGVTYPAAHAVVTRCESFIAALSADNDLTSEWTTTEIADWRQRLQDAQRAGLPSPPTIAGSTLSVIDALTAAFATLPDRSIVTTDSGYHQTAVRASLVVREPRQLLCPSDLQAMGFGLPAAIGAAVTYPERSVIAVIGDGGFALSALELATAVELHVNLVVLLLSDGYLSLIRRQQLADYGAAIATAATSVRPDALAEAVSCGYRDGTSELSKSLTDAIREGGVQIVEVRLTEAGEVTATATRRRVVQAVRRIAGPGLLSRFKKRI